MTDPSDWPSTSPSADPDGPSPADPTAPPAKQEPLVVTPRARRRAGRDAFDAKVLPDRAAEDDPERWGDRRDDDDRFLRDVPPHHVDHG